MGYDYIFDAYCGANMELINQFKSYGYSTDTFRYQQQILNAIFTGYRYGLSTPIDVYNLVKELGYDCERLLLKIDTTNLRIDNVENLNEFELFDSLVFVTEPRLSSMSNHDPWDVGSLEWLLSKYVDTPGVHDKIRNKLICFPDWYPLTRKILEDYLKLTN